MISKIAIFVVLLFLSSTRATPCGISPEALEEVTGFNSGVTKAAPRCGGLIDAAIGETSGITYKLFEKLEENERCVWIVRAPNATGYQFESVFLGFSEYSDVMMLTVTVVDVKGGSYDFQNSIIREGVRTEMAGSVMIVTLQTGDHSYVTGFNGFALQYTPSQVSDTSYSTFADKASVDIIPESELGSIRHPSSKEDQYPNNDLSVFVLPPQNSIYNPNRKTHLVYSRVGLEDKCRDELVIYRYNTTGPALRVRWEEAQRICHSSEVEQFSEADLLMIVFRSNNVTTSEGFHLTYSR